MPWVIASLFGLSLGAEIHIVAFICTRYFGLKNYGTIFGAMAGIMSFAAGFGPLLAGWAFDTSGSYTVVLASTLGCFLFSAFLIGSLGPYPDFSPQAQNDSHEEPVPGRQIKDDLTSACVGQ